MAANSAVAFRTRLDSLLLGANKREPAEGAGSFARRRRESNYEVQSAPAGIGDKR